MSEGTFLESEYDEFDPDEVIRHELFREEKAEAEEDVVVSYLRRRKIAYANVFTPGERTQADIDIVLNDLMWFCRAQTNTFDVRDGQHAERLSHMKEGRREAYYRIKEFAALDFDTLLVKYTNAITKET